MLELTDVSPPLELLKRPKGETRERNLRNSNRAAVSSPAPRPGTQNLHSENRPMKSHCSKPSVRNSLSYQPLKTPSLKPGPEKCPLETSNSKQGWLRPPSWKPDI